MRSSEDYMNALVFGIPLPPSPDIEVPLPEGFYVCLQCKTVTNYWAPGFVCANCEAAGEREIDMKVGN